MTKPHWNANHAAQRAGSDYLDNYPPLKERDAGYSLGDILRESLRRSSESVHTAYYERLTESYHAAFAL